MKNSSQGVLLLMATSLTLQAMPFEFEAGREEIPRADRTYHSRVKHNEFNWCCEIPSLNPDLNPFL
jgi:hypothetical protein